MLFQLPEFTIDFVKGAFTERGLEKGKYIYIYIYIYMCVYVMYVCVCI